ncbi:hypothetical protein HOY80DRAFT_1001526 [Tuber brumale]|nr:hypothetical protein HOY80DRAFT_1001526 [Tuber brumale]
MAHLGARYQTQSLKKGHKRWKPIPIYHTRKNPPKTRQDQNPTDSHEFQRVGEKSKKPSMEYRSRVVYRKASFGFAPANGAFFGGALPLTLMALASYSTPPQRGLTPVINQSWQMSYHVAARSPDWLVFLVEGISGCVPLACG